MTNEMVQDDPLLQLNKVVRAQKLDPLVGSIRTQIEQGESELEKHPDGKSYLVDIDKFFIQDDLVVRMGADDSSEPVIVVPSALKEEEMRNCHSEILAAHYGFKKSYQNREQDFTGREWPRI